MRSGGKKIELFINSLQSGGAEHQLCILANFLVEKGYQVTVSTINTATDHYELSPLVKRSRICKSNTSYLGKIIRVFHHFQVTSCDCLIVFCQRNSYYALRSLSWRRKRPRIICGERNFLSSPGKYEDILFSKYYPRLVKSVVCNSYSQADYIARRQPCLSGKIRTIINYTDLSIYSPKYRIPDKTVTKLLVLARFQKQKNCYRFVQAVSELRKSTRQRFTVDWYGEHVFNNSSARAYFDGLLELIQKEGVADIFRIHDPIRNVPELINQFDAVCLPSSYEGFSNAIAEGIACGKPMLVSDVSDNSIMVHDGENGFLFDPKSIESIVRAIDRFLNLSSSQQIQMGEKSREIAKELFDKDTFVDAYIRLIED